MALWSKNNQPTLADMLPYVHDISTATCVFCPYGTNVSVGDRVYIYDEKTVFGREQRERQMEVTAVKVFRSTGRMLSLDLGMVQPEEAARIATDSEVTMEALLAHRSGASTYDSKRPPVVVYFKACDEDDTTGSRVKHGALAGSGVSVRSENPTGLRGLGARLFSRGKRT